MPTGYTAAVQDGSITTLRDFAMNCARAFGALIHMRDEAGDAKIPETIPLDTSYHDEKIADAQATLEEVANLTDAECRARAYKEWEEDLAAYQKRELERYQQESRYKEMRDKVSDWAVSEELANLRKFMLDQLNQSIDFDCGYKVEAPVLLDATSWRAKELRSASNSISYHSTARDQEIERVAGRNKWLAELRASLPN